MFTEISSDAAALEELGRRIARHRLNRNLTQEALATEAGISTPTLQRMERGRSSQTSSLVRVLRALDLIGNLDALVPEQAISPVQQARMQGRARQRASSSTTKEDKEPWSWGDEE
jgi:putative transcriptional regulator